MIIWISHKVITLMATVNSSLSSTTSVLTKNKNQWHLVDFFMSFQLSYV